MTQIDQALEANRTRGRFEAVPTGPRPARQLVIVTCMDTRLDPYKTLGLRAGEAHIIRNAGGVVTDDTLRSLVLSHQALGTRELMIIGHTDCGLLGLDERGLTDRLAQETGEQPAAPKTFHSFDDLSENVRRQLRTVREHPWLRALAARGFIYDVKTGAVSEVDAEARSTT
ncbi:MAG: beta-class carbonic anhydrase [Phycisphaeraceae bacterium]